jgi:small subunit ribosomal protein S5
MHMSEETQKTENTKPEEKKQDNKKQTSDKRFSKKRKNTRRTGKRREREKPDYDQKIVSIRRVTRVMAGGRRFSFSVAIVIGDRRGRVGIGIGKAGDTSLAIEKAVNDAKKNMVQLDLTDTFSFPHEVKGKFNSAVVTMRPNGGRGIVAGSSMRTILELAGIKDVTAKILSRSKNQLNISRATILALDPFVKARGQKAQKKFTKGVVQKKGFQKKPFTKDRGSMTDAMSPDAKKS